MFESEHSFVGARVRLLHIDPNILLGLPDDEVRELKSRVNEIFKVIEQKNNYFYIEKYFEYDGGEISYQSIAVKLQDIEFIKNN